MLSSSQLFDMWVYMHNRAIHVLKGCGLIDQYGRVRKPINDETLNELATLRHVKANDWKEFIVKTSYSKNLPEWSKLYPKALIDMVGSHLADWMLHDAPISVFSEMTSQVAVIDISVKALREDLREVKFWYDTDEKANVLELDMANQYGNAANLIIKSNTEKSYDYMEALSNYLHQIGDSLRIIMRYRERKGSKILCTFLCDI